MCEATFDRSGGEDIYVTPEKSFEVVVERSDVEQRPPGLEVDVGVGSRCSLGRRSEHSRVAGAVTLAYLENGAASPPRS